MNRLVCGAALLFGFGWVAGSQEINTSQLGKYLEEKKVFFLDVREPAEIKELGSVPGYVNIPLGQLEKRLDELPKDKLILTL